MTRTLLVFDDDLVHHQDFLAGVGETLSADMTYFAHADDCVAAVAQYQPDAVLMDYSMGSEHLSGAEAVAELRATYPKGTLVVVGISSDAWANSRMGLAGADDGVVKAGGPTRLVAMLTALWATADA